MQIIRVLRDSMSKIVQDREDIRFEISRSRGRDRGSARGLQYATLLTTVEYSYASTRFSTDLRYIVSYLASKTMKRNADGCRSCYDTLSSATAVTGTRYDILVRATYGGM